MDQKNLELVVQLRHDLHRHPEVSCKEEWTKQYLMDFLKKHTQLEIVDRGLWFYAVYRADEGKRNIAFRADFDALPMPEYIDLPYGSQFPHVAHKCGHDGHSASLAGFALEIDQNGSENNIFFIFQHAEETGEGAAQCHSFVPENNIDEIFAYHNRSGHALKAVHCIDGTAHWASKGMIIHLEGKPAHASRPEQGINPAYAIAKLSGAVPDMIRPENYENTVLCTVIQVDVGERAFGIAASKGELLLTIRAARGEDMQALQDNLEKLAQEEADAQGLKVSFSYLDEFPDTTNAKESSDKIRQVCREKGLECIELAGASRGSEDFGHFLKQTQGAICVIGNGFDAPQIHTKEYDFPDEIIETAIELFKGLAAL